MFQIFHQVKMFAWLIAILGIFAMILLGSLQIDDIIMRRLFVGVLSCASLISMFASPLFIIVSM
jgi:solute carrier family 50 protein (sugar transporter)